MKIQDKEEITWKQLNSQHKDKEGIKEGELRKKLLRIMNNYGLSEHFEDTQNPEKYKDTMVISLMILNYVYQCIYFINVFFSRAMMVKIHI